jgi:DASH complex subunit Dad3
LIAIRRVQYVYGSNKTERVRSHRL